MGCWNETCFLTHLPIFHGERAVFIPLYQKYAMPGAHYVNDSFLFAGTPMTGEYNDYGIIEPVEKSESADITTVFFKEDIENDAITLQKKTSSEQDDITDVDSLVRAIERGRLICNKPQKIRWGEGEDDVLQKGGYGFNHILIHEKAYQLVIEDMGNRIPYDKPHNMRFYMERELKEHIPEEVKKAREVGFPLLGRKCKFLGEYFYKGERWAEAVTDGAASDLIAKLTELHLFSVALSYMRRQLMPTSGRGSQCQEMSLHLKLADFAKEKAKARVKSIREDMDEGEKFGIPAEKVDETLLSETAWYYERE